MPDVLKRGGRKRTAALRVLLVDNDAATRMLCSVNLGLLGIEVLEAEDGAEGFELARRERPDLVVLDVSMPGLSGLEVAELLRGHRWTRNIPFMFLSGEADDDARARVLGAFAYVAKPFDPIVLAELIARTLDPSRAQAVGV
ncbi:MAG: response regulator [Actinobacteria bacterium]|nr:response regulator [Actinomycetota bacterium]